MTTPYILKHQSIIKHSDDVRVTVWPSNLSTLAIKKINKIKSKNIEKIFSFILNIFHFYFLSLSLSNTVVVHTFDTVICVQKYFVHLCVCVSLCILLQKFSKASIVQ